VLLADDHPGILAVFQLLLEPDCEIVGRVSDGLALLQEAVTLKPDVIVLDIALPKVNGFEACRRLKQVLPESAIVVATASKDPELKENALRLGASAFLYKHLAADELLRAVRHAVHDQLPQE